MRSNKKAWAWKLLLIAILMTSIVFAVVSTINQEKIIIKIDNKTYRLSPKQLTASIDKALQSAEVGQSDFEKRIFKQIDKTVDSAKSHTQTYVDWHYSVPGATIRMSNKMPSAIRMNNKTAQEKMAQILFKQNSINEAFKSSENQLTQHIQTQLNAQKKQFLSQIAKELKPHQVELKEQQKQLLPNADLSAIFDNYLTQRLESGKASQQWGTATGTGAVIALGLTTRTLSKKAAAQASSKTAARSAGRLASIEACAPTVVTGVGAFACGAIVFVISTAVTEFTLLQIDKKMNGPELKLQLDNDLENIRNNLKSQYSAMLSSVLATDKAALESTMLSYARPIDFIK